MIEHNRMDMQAQLYAGLFCLSTNSVDILDKKSWGIILMITIERLSCGLSMVGCLYSKIAKFYKQILWFDLQ
jgi:hypothetical protein